MSKLESISREYDICTSAARGSIAGSSADLSEYPPYATTAMLGRYIPEANPDSPRAISLLDKLSKRSIMLRAQTGVTALVAILTRWSGSGLRQRMIQMIEGDMANLNQAAHLVVNGLSTLFLGACNYSMQIIAAPSRGDLDLAHSVGDWLEIGVPSLRNVGKLRWRKFALWLAIGMVSTLLHLVWNSTIFSSIPYAIFTGALVTSDFEWANDRWDNLTTVGSVRADMKFTYRERIFGLQERAANFTRLSKLSCLELYADSLNSTSDVVIVAKNVTSSQNDRSSLIQGWINGLDNNQWNYANFWVCGADPAATNIYCSLDRARSLASNWQISTWDWEAPHHQRIAVDYCLIGEQGDNDNRCGFHFNSYALAFVCVCTLLGCLLVLLVERTQKLNGISTIGDAIATFLEFPEYFATSNGDLQGSFRPVQDSVFRKVFSGSKSCGVTMRSAPWSPSPSTSWIYAISRQEWFMSCSFFFVGIFVWTACLAFFIVSLADQGIAANFSSLWKQGLGKVHGFALIQGPWIAGATKSGFLKQVLLTNGLQLFISCAYMVSNGIISRQLVAYEWVRLLNIDSRKPLRVTSPRCLQRSTYMISMPFKYSIPMMILFITLHWLVSQAVFIVQTIGYESGDANILFPDKGSSRVGVSGMGIALVDMMWLLLFCGLLAHSTIRKYKNVPTGFPRMATCSAAISAVCNPPKGDTDAHLFPLSMGVVDRGHPDQKLSNWLTVSTYVDLKKPQDGSIIIQPGEYGPHRGRGGIASYMKVGSVGGRR